MKTNEAYRGITTLNIYQQEKKELRIEQIFNVKRVQIIFRF